MERKYHEMENPFCTKDIFLAAYLQYRGIPAQLKTHSSGRVDFCFSSSDTLYRLFHAYNSGDAVPLNDYLDIYKMLKVCELPKFKLGGLLRFKKKEIDSLALNEKARKF